jgi:phosphoglycerol transferase MdoB-like AlkP superfamily enzyme
MSDSLSKILRIVLAILLTITLVLALWFVSKTGDIDSSLDADVQIEQFGSSLEWILNWTYVLFFAATGSAVLFSIVGIFKDSKTAKKAVLPILATIVIFVIAYALSSGDLLQIQGYTGTDNNPSTLKWVDTGIIATYFLFAGAAASIVFAEVIKIFR